MKSRSKERDHENVKEKKNLILKEKNRKGVEVKRNLNS